MKQSTHSKAKRRALLGAISTAGVVGAAKLPGQWTRPVVDHVLLPAHAATTDDTGAIGTGATSGSTFITTVTSNCVVTCTSAYALMSYETAPVPGSSSYIYVLSTYSYNYTQCSDSLGGFTTAQSYSTSGAFTSFVFTPYTSFCGSSSYIDNAICNVTVTSS